MYIVLSSAPDSWSYLWSSSVCSSLSFSFFSVFCLCKRSSFVSCFPAFVFPNSFVFWPPWVQIISTLHEFACPCGIFRLSCTTIRIRYRKLKSPMIPGLDLDWVSHPFALSSYVQPVTLKTKQCQREIKQRGWRILKTNCKDLKKIQLINPCEG